MNQMFDAYAAYYDLLYRGKDYAGEAAYVDRLIHLHRPGATDVLELGSGTGRHGIELATRGYGVTGIDMSESMVQQARERATTSTLPVPPRFSRADVLSFRSADRYDAVVSLFHVVSYQATNEALAAIMQTASIHLRPGGVFVFDCWYGPAVLQDPPVVRVRRLEDQNTTITRIAEPVPHPNDCCVDVNYEVIVERAGASLERIRETHRMRYLFLPEIDALLGAAGMRRVSSEGWLTGTPLGPDTWNACIIALK